MKLIQKAMNNAPALSILILLAGCASPIATIAKDSAIPTADELRADGYTIAEKNITEHAAYRPLKTILVDSVNAEMLATMQSAFPEITFVSASTVSEASDSYDAVLGRCGRGTLEKAPNAAWVHTYSAGVDRCMGLETMSKLKARDGGVLLTNSSGTAAPVIAEHTIAMMLTLSRGLHLFRDEQVKSQWSRGLAGQGVTSVINGKTMLVMGLGAIGQEVALRADALGMRVYGTRNSSREGPDYVEYVGLSDETLELAAKADVIVNALPLTKATRGFVGAKFFDTMKDDALYLSVGRGGTTDTTALISALRSKSIAGAGLDVTDPEPLPSDHPLWKETNVIITPHLSGSGGDAIGKVFELVLENIRRYQAGEPMLNIVDTELGY